MKKPNWEAVVCEAFVISLTILALTVSAWLMLNGVLTDHAAARPVPADPETAADLYPLVDFAEFASGSWKRPRATVIGTVIFVRKEADGDNHIRLEDGKGNVAVLEEIPELRLPSLPKAGDRIRAAGVSRWDDWPGHLWAELHPLTSWRIEP